MNHYIQTAVELKLTLPSDVDIPSVRDNQGTMRMLFVIVFERLRKVFYCR